MIPAEKVDAALRAWPCHVEPVTPLAGGWNSAAWLVVTAEGRFVAKPVDDLDAPGLASGLQIAEILAARGLPCGAPARARNGELTIPLPQGTLIRPAMAWPRRRCGAGVPGTCCLARAAVRRVELQAGKLACSVAPLIRRR